MNNVEGVTFNPFGKLDDIIQQKANDTGKIIEIYLNKLINYRHENDVISNFEHLGSNININNNVQGKLNNILLPHLIQNIPNIQNPNTFITNFEIFHKSIYYPKFVFKNK